MNKPKPLQGKHQKHCRATLGYICSCLPSPYIDFMTNPPNPSTLKPQVPSGVLREGIEKIITYHSELGEGTSGYLLSNDQIDALEALFKSHLQAEVEEIIGEDDFENGINRVDKLVRNRLRAEQRSRLTEKGKK